MNKTRHADAGPNTGEVDPRSRSWVDELLVAVIFAAVLGAVTAEGLAAVWRFMGWPGWPHPSMAWTGLLVGTAEAWWLGSVLDLPGRPSRNEAQEKSAEGAKEAKT